MRCDGACQNLRFSWRVRMCVYVYVFWHQHRCEFMRQLFFHHLISFYIFWWVKNPICESLRLGTHNVHTNSAQRNKQFQYVLSNVFCCQQADRHPTGIRLFRSLVLYPFLVSFDVRNPSIWRELLRTVRYTLERPHTFHYTPSTFDMRRRFFQLPATYILHIFNSTYERIFSVFSLLLFVHHIHVAHMHERSTNTMYFIYYWRWLDDAFGCTLLYNSHYANRRTELMSCERIFTILYMRPYAAHTHGVCAHSTLENAQLWAIIKLKAPRKQRKSENAEANGPSPLIFDFGENRWETHSNHTWWF